MRSFVMKVVMGSAERWVAISSGEGRVTIKPAAWFEVAAKPGVIGLGYVVGFVPRIRVGLVESHGCSGVVASQIIPLRLRICNDLERLDRCRNAEAVGC